MMRKNKDRGYQKLRVWAEAIEHYQQTSLIFRKFPILQNANTPAFSKIYNCFNKTGSHI